MVAVAVEMARKAKHFGRTGFDAQPAALAFL
jgi:hypothetical protein